MPRLSARRDPAYSPSGRRYSLDPGSPVRRSKRLEVGTASPTPSISLRATTPDARQLHETLRAASESPTKETHGSRAQSSAHSSATPSPPIQHTISTTSTPTAPSLNPAITTENDVLEEQSDHGFSFFRYPRLPSLGFGRKASSPVLTSPQVEDFFDNESVVSWQLERELHRDDIQRTKPNGYPRDITEGRNIRAPPRRLSGLTWTNDTSHSVDNTKLITNDIATTNDDDNDTDQDDDDGDSDEKTENPAERTAAVRTVISTTNFRESADESLTDSLRPSTPVDRTRRIPMFTGTPKEGNSKWPLFVATITAALLVAAVAVTIYFLKDHLQPNNNPFTRPQYHPPINASEGRIITQLSNEVDKLGVQISSVSKDVHRLTAEQRQMVDQVTIVSPVAEFEQRINFLSPGLGTHVDVMLTSPSIGTRRTLPRRVYERLSGHYIARPNPPEVALEAWEDIGDCWCSAPGKAGQAQLALELGERAILDEVVVEHIAASASPDPGVAPREMELWARFKPFRDDQRRGPAASSTETIITSESGKSTGWLGRFRPSTSSSSSTSKQPIPSSLSSLLDAIMRTLHQAYPSEMETAYSNDRLLGPSYFRLGKWEYDRTGDAVQHFALDALIDYPTLRVDKVVLRVKSNWGGNHTCLYRVKLHGHV